MKVLFLTNIPSPYKMDFFEILSINCDLTVLFERADTGNRDASWLKKNSVGFKSVYLSGFNIGDENALCFEVIKFILKRNYEIVILGQYSSPTTMLVIPILKALKIPYYISTDGGMVSSDSGMKKKIKTYFMSDAIGYFSPSKMSDDFLNYYGANSNIFRYPFTSVYEKDILTNVVQKEEKDQIRAELGVDEEKVVLAVGQFIPRKGFDILLQSAKELKDSNVGFYFVGGKATEEYLEFRERYKLSNVHFIGFKSKNELSYYYKMSDAFVLPTREDIWGLVINEALSYGLPVITTDKCNAGLEMIRNDYNGYIVPVEDAVAIVKYIEKIFNDNGLQQKLSYNALNTAREYTLEEMAQCYVKAIQGEVL